MHYYALITPTNTGSNSNPGWHYITAGIERLVRLADDEASFVEVSMLGPDPAWHMAAANCRAMFFCGNPRFNTVEDKTFWDWDIWERIERLMDLGVPLIDAWAGSAHPLPIPPTSEMVKRISSLKKTAAILAHEKKALLCIARDVVASELLLSVNPNTVFWPCSTWWAAEEISPDLPSTASQLSKTHNIIVLRRVDDWQISFDDFRLQLHGTTCHQGHQAHRVVHGRPFPWGVLVLTTKQHFSQKGALFTKTNSRQKPPAGPRLIPISCAPAGRHPLKPNSSTCDIHCFSMCAR